MEFAKSMTFIIDARTTRFGNWMLTVRRWKFKWCANLDRNLSQIASNWSSLWKPWWKDIPKWAPYVKHSIVFIRNNKYNWPCHRKAPRRYYSTKEFVFNGKKVFSVKEVRDDKKFLDQGDLTKWFVLNDAPFREQIERFGDFPIATRFDKGEPRLLVTAVDIAEGIAVTFDSYKKSDGKRKTVYYPGTK